MSAALAPVPGGPLAMAGISVAGEPGSRNGSGAFVPRVLDTYREIESVRIGDVIIGNRREPHVITRIVPYVHPMVGEQWCIAYDAAGWGITIENDAPLRNAS